MKNILITVIVLILLFSEVVTVSSQMMIRDTIVPPKREQIEVRQGNLTYLKIDNNRYEPLNTKALEYTGKSYEHFLDFSSREHYKNTIIPLIRSVFTEERAKQLAKLKLYCAIAFSPVENKMLHFSFLMMGQDNEEFPLKLDELDKLEKTFRSETKLIQFQGRGKIVDHGERYNIAIRFDSLYE